MPRNVLAIAAVAGVLLAGPVLAHAKLLNASPADGAQLVHAPKALTLSFAEPVQLASVALNGDGGAVPVAIDRTAKPTGTVVVPLPALKPGRYKLNWSVVSPGDGHVAKGSLAFTLQPTQH